MVDKMTGVLRVLEQRGWRGQLRRFGVAVPSAAAAAEQLSCDVGAVANSLVFKVGNDLVLVLASGAHRVDVGAIASARGVGKKKVRRADPESVRDATGQEVGGVAPVGHRRPLPCLIDVALEAHPTVWAGAGDEYTMFATSAAELALLTDGELIMLADPLHTS